MEIEEKSMNKFRKSLKTLLDELDAANAMHEGNRDAEYLAATVLNGFLRNQPGYTLPQGADCDGNVRMAMLGFLMAVRDLTGQDCELFGTFHKRLAAFQDKNTVSDNGHDFEHFFGRLNEEDFDEDGKAVDNR